MADARQSARNLIERHGLRAGAVAEEHATQARAGGDIQQAEQWQAVAGAVADLRRTGRQTERASA